MTRTAEEQREFMKHYMRRYRHPELFFPAPGCMICGVDLEGRKSLYCGRKCRQHAYHLRHGDKNRARYRAWHAANLERSIERVRAWRKANPKRFREYINKWRRQACPYCDQKLTWPAKSCRACAVRYGCLCHDNPMCGVEGAHKHCPCGMPVFKKGHYHVEPCSLCIADMRRLGLTFTQLFESTRESESSEIAA